MASKLFNIFRTGTFTARNGLQSTFGEGDLQNMVAAYDPKRRSAPLVLGHPKDDQPAMGQVQKLIFKDGGLYAQAMVGAALEQLVKDRRYVKVSAAFFSPSAENNPTPGLYYLKHVGFLGAYPPAVKGLEPLKFASGNDGVCFGETEIIAGSQTDYMPDLNTHNYDPERLALHRQVLQCRNACPSLSYGEAVTMALKKAQVNLDHNENGYRYDPERLPLHRLASEYCEGCPSLSYSEAVELAQGVLTV